MDSVTTDTLKGFINALNMQQGKEFHRAKMIPGGVELDFVGGGKYTTVIFLSQDKADECPVENEDESPVEIVSEDKCPDVIEIPFRWGEMRAPAPEAPSQRIRLAEKKRGRPFAKKN